MTRNIELKTQSRLIASAVATDTIGGVVPAGMKRWVTFITLDGASLAGAKSVRLYLASVGVSNPIVASIVATANRKMVIDLRASGMTGRVNLTPDGPPLMIPDKPDADKPLFSIAGGKWLGATTSRTTALVHVQYFDE
ncbi:MAG: hypothetical protein V1854_03475 [Methanobacteriota archaeon]